MEYKILLIGDAGVGKSSLILRLTDNTFTDKFMCTIGTDMKNHILTHNGKEYKLAVWDTAGQERFRTITSSYYQGTAGIIIVFDITDQVSFNNVKSWLTDVDHYTTPETGFVGRILVGNKSDLTNKRVVNYNTAREYADGLGLPYLETSAKTGINVESAFTQLVSLISNYYQKQQQLSTQPAEPVAPKQKIKVNDVKKRSGCNI